MRIGVVSQFYSPFLGDKPQLLARGLAERGHAVCFITTHSVAVREQPYVTRGGRPGIQGPFEVRVVPHLLIMRDNVVTYPPGRWIDSEYDALVLFEDYPWMSKAVALWAHRRGIPVTICSERYYYPADRLGSLALGILDRTVHPLMWRASHLLLCHSHAAVSFFADLGAPQQRIRYLPGWIDAEGVRAMSERAKWEAPRAETGPQEIISVGRLHPYKGFDTLISAAHLLHLRGRECLVTIVGRGPLEKELRDRIHALGLEEKVRIETTPVPNAQIPRLLSRATVYVQPSYIEPFGAAAVEAMACGIPLVASAVGGLRDSVLADETGLLVPPRDPVKLSAALDQLISDSELAKKMGDRGRDRALAVFDYRVCAERCEELLGSSTP